MLTLPDQNWTSSNTNLPWIVRRLLSGVVPASELNETAQPVSETQMTTIGDRERLRVLYGRVRVGAQVLNAVPYGGAALAVQCVWGEGEISSIESVRLNNETPAVSDGHYMGTPAQTVNAVLAYGMAQMGVSYSDTLNGIAYSVLRVPMDAAGMEIAAIINGKKLYDPRSGLTVWSDNPALALADFLSSTVYGMGLSVDWASVTTVANACDELVSGVKRRRLGLVIDEARTTQEWLNTLRTYAGCWVVIDGSIAKLVADRPRSTDKTILHASGQIAALGKIGKRGTSALPNAVEIIYTDTSVIPWREASVLSPTMGLPSGLPPSQVALPGIQNASQARREAIERINKLWLSDLSVELTLFDDGVAVEVGDVIEVTHPIGLSAKKMRVLDVANDYGRFRVSASEYDPAVYSDAVATDPSYPDTNFTSPTSPPTLTGLTAVEELYQLENGNYSSRIRAAWSAPTTYPYPYQTEVEVWGGGVLLGGGLTRQVEWASPSVQELVTYQVRIRIAGSTGAVGTWAYASVTAVGKFAPPGNVPLLSGFEAGGRVYLSWQPAIDIDIWRYEVRYGSTGGTWETAKMVDRVDALTLVSDQVPVGTWKFHVKALDSVGQYSATAATVNVTVTSDASAFLIDTYDQTAPTLTNMASFRLSRTDDRVRYVTDDGVAWNTKFSSPLNTYTNPLATYHNSVTSTWLGEAEDFGSLLGGQWTGTADASDVSGSHVSSMGFSADGSSWSYLSGLSQKQNARFARLKHEALTTSTLLVTAPAQQIRLDAIPREEVGTGTSSASGAVTVTLENDYIAVRDLTITPEGSTARSATYDNIVTGSPTTFDVHVFNDAGTRIASAFRYRFRGV